MTSEDYKSPQNEKRTWIIVSGVVCACVCLRAESVCTVYSPARSGLGSLKHTQHTVWIWAYCNWLMHISLMSVLCPHFRPHRYWLYWIISLQWQIIISTITLLQLQTFGSTLCCKGVCVCLRACVCVCADLISSWTSSCRSKYRKRRHAFGCNALKGLTYWLI